LDIAALPPTTISAPRSLPTVCGTMSVRSLASAAYEVLSLPDPPSGTLTMATLPFWLWSVVMPDSKPFV
jgi:hypothetical protein